MVPDWGSRLPEDATPENVRRRSEHILNIPDAKTPTGIREVNLVYGLRPILYAHLDDLRSGAPGGSPVFATRSARERATIVW